MSVRKSDACRGTLPFSLRTDDLAHGQLPRGRRAYVTNATGHWQEVPIIGQKCGLPARIEMGADGRFATR